MPEYERKDKIMEAFYITKESYKIMKYTYFHKEVPLGKLSKKFGTDTIALIDYLCSIQFGVIRKPDKHLTDDCTNLTSDDLFGLMIPGEHYVWEQQTATRNFWIPTLISVIALSISAITSLLA